MKTIYDEDDDLARPIRETDDREITLNSATLLAIFFGLVLLCALFFGMGYTLGRRAPAPVVADAGERGSTTPLAAELKPKPSASSLTPAAQPQVEEAVTPEPQTPEKEDAPTPAVRPQVQEAVLETNTAKPTAVAQTEPAPVSNGIMVQIAAIANPADADVLVSALHKRGYTTVTRHEPSDALLHVQIGPFATRSEAGAMRQKLLSDGYNAILK